LQLYYWGCVSASTELDYDADHELRNQKRIYQMKRRVLGRREQHAQILDLGIMAKVDGVGD